VELFARHFRQHAFDHRCNAGGVEPAAHHGRDIAQGSHPATDGFAKYSEEGLLAFLI
jgi:hypothetical protein